MSKGGTEMLEVKDLYVNYGAVEAIKGISFTVQPGEIVTLIGANGAGKNNDAAYHFRTGQSKKAGVLLITVPIFRRSIRQKLFHLESRMCRRDAMCFRK